MEFELRLESVLGKKYPGVYLIWNSVENKGYIGQSQNMHVRCTSHLNALRRGEHDNKKMQDSWNRYGEDTFFFMSLMTCEIEELCEWEVYWIEFFGWTHIYNIWNGCPIRGNKLREEQKRKISETLKGRVPPKPSLENLKLGPKARQKKIKMLDLNGSEIQEFDSIKNASLYLNKNSDDCIRAALKGRVSHAYGYKWSYA